MPTQEVFDAVLVRPVLQGCAEDAHLVHVSWRAPRLGGRLVQVYVDAELVTATRTAEVRSVVLLSAEAQAIDLAFFDDAITLVWLENDEGASIGYGAAEDGWPVTPHLKLAEVTIADGVITLIVDRRIEQVLADAPIATEVQRGQVYQAEASANVAALTDNSGGTSGDGTIAAVTGVDASAVHAIATLAAYCNTLRADLNTLKQHLRDAGTLAT